MSDPQVKFNTGAVPNLVFKKPKNNLELSVVVTQPERELALLKKIAAHTGKKNEVDIEDLELYQTLNKNPKDKNPKNDTRLEGRHLYQNDSCPMMSKFNLRYDLNQAYQMLNHLKKEMGTEKFNKSKIIFTETFMGEFNTGEHPMRHHVIHRAEGLTPDNEVISDPSSNKANSMKAANKSGEETINLNVYDHSEVLLSQTIKNPIKEYEKLTEIASLDGNDDSISESDLAKARENKKLENLEGYDLYTDDSSDEATLIDLNTAYSFLYTAKKKGANLSDSQVIFQEKLSNPSNRFIIETGQIILNEATGQYFRIENKSLRP